RGEGPQKKQKKPTTPPRRNNQHKRNTKLNGHFERGTMGNVPYPEDGDISATIGRENRCKRSQSGAKPRIVGDYSQSRFVGCKPPRLHKPAGIDATDNIAAQDLQ